MKACIFSLLKHKALFYLIYSIITLNFGELLYTKELSLKKQNKVDKQKTLNTNGSNIQKQNKENYIKTNGIGFIRIGNSLAKIEHKLSKIKIIRIRPLAEYYYYIINDELKKDKNFENTNILIKNKTIHYKDLVEFKLVAKKNDTTLNGYYPKQILYPTSKIHPKLIEAYLKFYKSTLYECSFYLKLDLNDINNIVEEYHDKLGENSNYSKTLEEYSWEKDSNYKITLSLLGQHFPRRIKINFTHIKNKELMQNDVKQMKAIIDKLLY